MECPLIKVPLFLLIRCVVVLIPVAMTYASEEDGVVKKFPIICTFRSFNSPGPAKAQAQECFQGVDEPG